MLPRCCRGVVGNVNVRLCRCRFPRYRFLNPKATWVWGLMNPVSTFALNLTNPFELIIKPNQPLLAAGGRVRLYTVHLYPNPTRAPYPPVSQVTGRSR
jgi:hypothetical protein